MQAKMSHFRNERLRAFWKVVFCKKTDSLVHTGAVNTLWKVQKVAKKVPKYAHHRILFTSEMIFNIEEKFNCQNDHVYAKSYYEAKDKIPRVQCGHHPPLVMVWWGVSYYSSATQIHFCNAKIKTNGAVYQVVLNDVSLEETVLMD